MLSHAESPANICNLCGLGPLWGPDHILPAFKNRVEDSGYQKATKCTWYASTWQFLSNSQTSEFRSTQVNSDQLRSTQINLRISMVFLCFLVVSGAFFFPRQLRERFSRNLQELHLMEMDEADKVRRREQRLKLQKVKTCHFRNYMNIIEYIIHVCLICVYIWIIYR